MSERLSESLVSSSLREEEEEEEEEKEKRKKMDFEDEWERKKTWLCFFFLGCLNNFAYVVIISGAKSLATNDFEDSKSLIGVINWALVGLGLAARGANMFMEKSTPKFRTAITTGINAFGIAILTISPQIGSFWIAIGAIVLIGSACSFGESVILGYLKAFPQRYTGAWSSGTGLAGDAGSLYYLGLSSASLSDPVIFATMMALVPVYWTAFVNIRDPSKTGFESLEQSARRQSTLFEMSDNVVSFPGDGGGGGEEEEDDRGGTRKPRESTFDRLIRCTGYVLYFSIHLAAVYFFEYVISVGFAAAAEGTSDETNNSSDYWIRNSYKVFSFWYQFGVLLSRSSLSIYQFEGVWYLTLLQGGFFVLFLFQVLNPGSFMPIWLQFVAMVCVGLFGGAMYVNVFALVMKDRRIPAQDMEFSINIVCIFINLGIVCASIFDIIMTHTFIEA